MYRPTDPLARRRRSLLATLYFEPASSARGRDTAQGRAAFPGAGG